MGQSYNGQAIKLQKLHPHIRYVIPKEGGNVWADYFVVMKQSKNPKLAFDFINFINEPENAAKLSKVTQFATANKTAEKFVPTEDLKNPAIYVADDVLERSDMVSLLPPRVEKKYNDIFSKIRN